MAERAFLRDCLAGLLLFEQRRPVKIGLGVTSGRSEKDLGKDKLVSARLFFINCCLINILSHLLTMEKYSSETESLLKRIDAMKLQVDELRPISDEQEARIFQKFRLDWNYNSNSIEGNKLTYGETAAFLMEGLTAKGKPLKDHLDIKGHNEAINYLTYMQQQDSVLTESDIRALHKMILVEPYQNEAQTTDGLPTTKTIRLGEYKSSSNHVKTVTGAIHYYASVEDTPILMRELIEWYRANEATMHPLILSTLFHHRFVGIHPFDDGNGRMTRLLSNLILMKAGYPPLIVRQDEKGEYYGVLSQADAGVMEPLLQFFAERLIRSLDTYLRGARGEDISDPTDLDKEMALFVAGFDEDILSKVPLDIDVLASVIRESLLPFTGNLFNKGRKINSLFFDTNVGVSLYTLILDNKSSNPARYEAVSSDEFVNKWLNANGIFNNIILDYYRNIKTEKALRVLIHYQQAGFKADEKVGVINNYIYFDFVKSHYSVSVDHPNSSADKPLLFEIKKSYPKMLSSEDILELTTSFFKSMMTSIKYKADLVKENPEPN